MADYKELLRRAVEALPENNGAARRAVYEKARAALVGQLRAINPPLAARDITTHRLQLEDCIRQVEQEASEAVIAGLNGHGADASLPPPVYFEPPPSANKQLPGPGRGPAKPQLNPVAQETKSEPKAPPPGASIEDIIAAADRDAREHTAVRNGAAKPEPKTLARPIQLRAVPAESQETEDDREQVAPPKPVAARPGGRPLPAIVARAEAAKGRSGSSAFTLPAEGRRGPTLEARRDGGNGGIGSLGPRLEPVRGPQLVARQQAEPLYLEAPSQQTAAMSAVREVEVEPEPVANDPQGLIDRAMATLDREARGETEPIAIPLPKKNGAADPIEDDEDDEGVAPSRPALGGMFPDAPRRGDKGGRAAKPAREPKAKRGSRAEQMERGPKSRRGAERESAFAEAGFPRARAEDERGGISAVTIFLMVFAVLLLGAGGAGFWAWNEGYLNLDSVFANKPAAVATTTTPAAPAQAAVAETSVPTPVSGPGNTTLSQPVAAAVPEMKQGDRLPSEPLAAATQSQALAITEPAPAAAAPQRLGEDNAAAAIGAATDTAALNPEGSQSLLLEASDDGKTGAVPFSGTVEWSQGKDETGLPTLVGKASIPARNLGVDILIRKNVDSTLPASHLMEISFKVSDSFIGGSVAGLPGVLLKNEELVQGQPLVGASARVVGNSFLFALSASPEDTTANRDLLTSRKWMDLAVIYATGKRAIITLEKDSAAQTMFTEVFQAWSNTAAAQPAT
ncbi:MAG TPA: hypothetical protein VIN06_04140 [Devosia sp.]